MPNASESDVHSASIRAVIGQELSEPVRPSVDWLANEIAARHGKTVLGVLFYGSCLRKETDEGVLDFWVVVDDYSAAYSNPVHAWINPIAPPNVFFLEREYESHPLRTKYGVISRRDFARGTSLSAWHPYIWARFAQPARLLACRDSQARSFFEESITHAILTAVARLIGHLPDQAGLLRFSLAAFWREAFRRTYDSERRPEADESIQTIYDVNPERYDAVASSAFHHLVETGIFADATEHPNSFSISILPKTLNLMRFRWKIMRPFSRILGLARLLKTAFTFGDWVPYALWKIERHTGRKIELTPRQREHPLIFAWPIILPLLLRRNLR